MPVQKIEFEYDIPEGYRFVRYGAPKKGERYLDQGKMRMASHDYKTESPIVEPVLDRKCSTETSKRHKNADLIHAWAEGAIIQFKASNGTWTDCPDNHPRWHSNIYYRIKPAI